jgi:phosphohistidine phosphatase
MKIFIMRHGQASLKASLDAQRPLTKQGVNEVCSMAKWIKKSTIRFDHVFVSPYKRAQQTAKSLLLAADLPNNISTLDFITPNDNAKKFHDYIDGFFAENDESTILVVSHMPLVSYLVSELTAGQASPVFQTAAIAEINYDTNTQRGIFKDLVEPH